MFKTRLTSGRALAIAVCVIGLSLILVAVVMAGTSGTVGHYTVTFISATYDSGANETTFVYQVCSDGGSGQQALSHWVIELCKDDVNQDKSAWHQYVDGSAQGYGTGARSGVQYCEVEAVNPDGACGLITGIKFGEAKTGGCAGTEDLLGEGEAAECDEFTFRLSKNWTGSPGDTGFAVKAPGCAYAGSGELVDGPDCTAGPTAVTLSSLAAKSSAGGSASPLWLGLVGLTMLAAGSLFWAKRRGG
jgi:hypothetical protein